MNITCTYLFTLIINNDYITLEKIIDTNKDRDVFLKRKSYETLVSKAVLVRARQCFDLLCNMIIEDEEDRNMFYIRALHNAIDYYIAAPNPDNMYYIDMIMKRNITIDYYAMYKSLKNNDMFIRFFHLFDKNIVEIKKLIIMAIMNNAENNFEFLYNYIDTNHNIENNIQFKTTLYEQAIYSNNIDVIEFLISKKLDWTHINNIPVIHHMLNVKQQNMFNYIYAKYKELGKEELNKIPNIRNTIEINFHYNMKTINNFKKIFSLPIDMMDMTIYIIRLFEQLYSMVQSTTLCYQNMFNYKYTIMEIIFQKKLVKNNPLKNIDYNEFISHYKKNLSYLSTKPELALQYVNNMKRFVEICNMNGYILDTFVI